MLMLYNSDNFVVVEHAVPGIGCVAELPPAATSLLPQEPESAILTRGGFEIVDKSLRREIYLEGALAEQFRQGVQALMDGERTPEAFDAFIEQYAGLAAVPLALH